MQEFCEDVHLDCKIPIGFIIEIQDYFYPICMTIPLNRMNEKAMPSPMNSGGIIVQKIRPQPGNVVRVQHDFSTSVDLVTTGFGAPLLWFVGCQSDGEALSKYTSS